MPERTTTAWRCRVCGYIHHGPEAPETCPICGVGPEEFDPYTEPSAPPSTNAPAARAWRCTVCNYVVEGEDPPEVCPVCGAGREAFEPVEPEPAAQTISPQPAAKIVVVGGGVAGVSAIEAIRKQSPDAGIALIAREPELPYYRLNLTRLLAGEVTVDQLPLHPRSWYEARKVELVTGAEAVSIDRPGHAVALRDGRTIAYDKLVLAVGAHAFMPPIGGVRRRHVFALRTLADAKNILALAGKDTRAAVVGGGILGLEAAGALARQGAAVSLLESYGFLMPRQLNEDAARRMGAFVEGLGIRVLYGVRSKEIVGGETATGVLLEDGRTVPADLVIVATGIRPNSGLARKAGLDVDQGVIVDDQLRSSDPDIYAAGDVAEHRGVLYGLWNAAQYQGGIAGMNAAGGKAEFGGIPRSATLKVLGMDMFSIGSFNPTDGSYQVVAGDIEDRFYHFVFQDNRLVGGILLGDTALSGAMKRHLEEGTDLSGLLATRPDAAAVAAGLSG